MSESDVLVVPANEASWDDLQAAFGRGAAARCQCQRIKLGDHDWFRMQAPRSAVWQPSTRACPEQSTTRCDADRKSTRLNSSHVKISYAVFCLKKKKKTLRLPRRSKKHARLRAARTSASADFPPLSATSLLLGSSTICILFFFFNDTATTEIYTLSLHDALPISSSEKLVRGSGYNHVIRQAFRMMRSEEHTSELQSRENLVCRLLLEKKKKQ